MSDTISIIFIIFSLGWFVFFSAIFIRFLFVMALPLAVGGAFFVATPDEKIVTMLKLADIKPVERAVDLGAGDGKIVIALAKLGIQAHGYEINPFLVWRARQKIKQAGLSNKAFMHCQNLWKADISGFDVIIIYGISFAMKGLQEKIQKEAKPGAKIISNYFIFPDWPPAEQENDVYLYIK